MNIFSADFIKAGYEMIGIYYVLQTDRHAESIYLAFQGNEDESKEQKHYFIHNATMLSSWMQILDYGAANELKSRDAFQILQKAKLLFSENQIKDPQKLGLYLKDLSKDQLSAMVESLLKSIKEAIELRPALSYLYPLYYQALKCMMDYGNGTLTPEETAQILCMQLFSIYDEIQNLQEEYDSSKEYCQAIFLTANEPDSDITPESLASLYHLYCIESGKKDFSTDYGERLSCSMIPVENISWESYFAKHKDQYRASDEKTVKYNIDSMSRFLHIGIDQMISSESVLRICKLCGGYFRIRYTSSQEYCTRLYGDTKTACNEYASRKSYKEKLFKHPIHQEFTKAYNKLYGRIRRGKIPADTPLMDQLKRLHDDYYERYENTHQKDREAVWKEYIEKNKTLLA